MIVSFRSNAFNTSSPEKHFVSVRAFGSDLANWLIHELARRDAAVEPMIQSQGCRMDRSVQLPRSNL